MSDINLVRTLLEKLVALEEKRTIFFRGGIYLKDKENEMHSASKEFCDAARTAIARLEDEPYDDNKPA